MQIIRHPGSENNGLANMLATLAEQNLQDKPELAGKVRGARGRIAIIADDADVAVTVQFGQDTLGFYHGIVGLPDLTFRGGFESIAELSRSEVLGSMTRRLRKTQAYLALTQKLRADQAVGLLELALQGIGQLPGIKGAREFVHELPDVRGEVNRSLWRALRKGDLRVHGLPRALPLLIAMGTLLSVHDA